MIPFGLLAALVASAALPVQVQGTSRCPTASEVAAILPELLPVTDVPRRAIAWIETRGLDLSITLREPDGATLLSRRITLHGTCADLANAAAVVIASWQTERNSELSLLQPGVQPPVATKAEARSPALPTAVVGAPAANPGARRRLSLELAGGVGASANRSGWATSGRVEVALRRGRPGLRVSFASDSEREQAIDAGSASWRRSAAGIGPCLVVVDRSVALELDAQLLAGMTSVRGDGFPVTRQSSGFSAGLASGLRLAMGDGRARPWLEVGGQYWLAPVDIAVDNSPARVHLPRTELRLLLGFSILLAK